MYEAGKAYTAGSGCSGPGNPEAQRVESPMEQSLKRLHGGVDACRRQVNELYGVLFMPAASCENEKNAAPTPLKVRTEIEESCASIENANEALSALISALRDELGNKKILG